MNNQMFDIEPITKTKIDVIKKFAITNLNINLFQNCSMTVLLYDDNNKLIDGMYLTMTTEEYNQWASDDNFIINWIKEKIISQ